MSGNCELGRGLLRREKNATEGGAGRFEKPAPDARAAPPEAHESLIGRKTVEEVPLTGLSLTAGLKGRRGFQTAAHLTDHVIPPMPVRQWVISVPKRLRGVLADRPVAVTTLTRIFLDDIERWLGAAVAIA